MVGRPREFSEAEMERRVELYIKLDPKLKKWFKHDCWERSISMRVVITGWIESYKEKSEAYWRKK